VEEANKREVDPLKLKLLTEELLAHTKKKSENATFYLAQLTVFWPHGLNGKFAATLVELANKAEAEPSPPPQHTEERNVKSPAKLKNATLNHAQLTVSWETGLNGLYVTRPVEVALKTDHDQ